VKASKTVEQVLQSIKSRYNAAGQAKGVAESQIDTCRGTLALMKQEQARKMDDIKRLCHEIHGIYRNFQFVDELQSVSDSLEMEKRQLRSTTARQAAEATIRGLKAFIDDLCKAVPRAPVRAPLPDKRHVPSLNEGVKPRLRIDALQPCLSRGYKGVLIRPLNGGRLCRLSCTGAGRFRAGSRCDVKARAQVGR
jgi:HPt (histidine-containing phosphotransfer) domain-containing protein